MEIKTTKGKGSMISVAELSYKRKMSEKKTIGKNAILNAIRTICGVLFPLITFPYATRVLHVENIGIYNFYASVISYFILLAGLGINNYAIREGSKHKNNKEDFSDYASEIFSINVISTILSYAILFIICICGKRLQAHIIVLIVLSIQIFFKTFGCEWVFSIYEDYGYITLRSIIFQIVSMVLLFVFVRSENDLVNYAVIHVIATTGSNIVNFISRRKYCKLRFLINQNTKKHIKPILLLFATTIASTIYVNSDITMLGIISGNKATGLYAVATRIYSLVKSIMGSMIIVSIPRLSSYIGTKDIESYRDTCNQLIRTIITLILPISIGIFLLSDDVILLISGIEYIRASIALKILCFALVFSVVGWFYASCIMLVNKCEHEILIATVASACINVILNIILIRYWAQTAAALTTAIAECVNMGIGIYYGRKYFVLSLRRNEILSTFIGCMTVILVCIISKILIPKHLLCIIVCALVSAFLYFLVLSLFKNPAINSILGLIRGKRKE